MHFGDFKNELLDNSMQLENDLTVLDLYVVKQNSGIGVKD